MYSVLRALPSSLYPEFGVELPSSGKSKYLEVPVRPPQRGDSRVPCPPVRLDQGTLRPQGGLPVLRPRLLAAPAGKRPATTGLRSWRVEIPNSGAGRWDPAGTPAPCRGPGACGAGWRAPGSVHLWPGQSLPGSPPILALPALLPSYPLHPHPPAFLECGCLF